MTNTKEIFIDDMSMEDIIKEQLEIYERIGADDYVVYLHNSNFDKATKDAIKEAVNNKFKEEYTPKKGVITKEVWDVPMPSYKDIIMNKDIDYQLLSNIMLKSNFGGRVNNMDNRYIYKVKLWDNKIELDNGEVVNLMDGKHKLPIIANELGMSLSTFKRKLKALMDTKLGLIEIGINESGDVFYNIKYAKDGKYYVTIPSDVLEYLITVCNSNMIKFYILFRYNLTEPIFNEDGTFKELRYIKKQMTYDYLLENIGYSTKLNRKKVLTMIDGLISLGLLKAYEIDTPIQTIDKKTNQIKTLTVKGYEYELVKYDVWRENRHIKKAI